ncbi:alginate lyase [Novosphingobium sp. P6W]|nr:alginate lyase [Novosphingobium sp. P6W]
MQRGKLRPGSLRLLIIQRRRVTLAAAVALFAVVGSGPIDAHENRALAGYALLGPDFASGKVDAGLKEAVESRARTFLRQKPRPATHIHIEGISSGQAHAPGVTAQAAASTAQIEADKSSLRDMEAMFDLALAWRLSGEKTFLRQAIRYIDAWVSVYEPSFNPIDEGRFDKLILAYDLVERSAPAATRAKVDSFLRKMASGYIAAMETGDVPIKPTLTNNWQSHRIKLATLAAYQIGDAGLITRANTLFERQVEANLRPDGSTLDFAQRDALHYVNYSLSSQLMAALAAQSHGADWYGYRGSEGRSLPRTLDWLGVFASGQQLHVEFVKSVVPYDRQRAAAGGSTYQNKPWDPATSQQLFAMAAKLDPKLQPLAARLHAQAAARPGLAIDETGPGEWLAILNMEPVR